MCARYDVRLSVAALIAFGTACGDGTGPGPAAFNVADATRGGIAYNMFWSAAAGFDQSDTRIAAFNAKSDFFRCKQCHGWDLLGQAGAYIGRRPSTSRPNIAALDLAAMARTASPLALFDAIKTGSGAARRSPTADLTTYNPATNPTVGDQMPDYGAIMSDVLIWDIVRFLKIEAFDVTQLYDAVKTGTYPTGSIAFSNLGLDGSAAAGDVIYAAKCEFCHGLAGKAFSLEGQSLGAFVRSKPQEAQHKIRYGQLGSIMGPTPLTLAEMKNLYRALSDATKFPP